MEEKKLLNSKEVRITLLLVVLYIVLTMLSNISSLRIIKVLKFSMDAGTLLYPLTFTMRDVLHKQAGRKIATYTIFLATLANIIMFLVFNIISRLPADMAVGPQKEFGLVLNASWRIVVGSLLAMLVSELVDTQLYHWFVTKITKKFQWMRLLFTNSISIPLDTIIMIVIAFLGTVSFSVIVSMIIANILLKYIVMLVSINLIYVVSEGTDKVQ